MRNYLAAKFSGTAKRANLRHIYPQADETGLILHCWYNVKIKKKNIYMKRNAKGERISTVVHKPKGFYEKQVPHNTVPTERE